jgi:hypothetical protein
MRVVKEHTLPTQDVKAGLRSLMSQYALPSIHSVAADLRPMSNQEATMAACAAIKQFTAALRTNDATEVENCFYAEQAFWKDQLALTWHLRTMISPNKIAKGLLETMALRKMSADFGIRGEANFVQAGPNLVS